MAQTTDLQRSSCQSWSKRSGRSSISSGKQYASGMPPPLALNKHCPECKFRSRCRQIAVEKDDLSLLTTLSEKDRKKLNRKGITTVAQFSCTYRPRRRSARNRTTAIKHEPALKALAIQANRIHVVDTPTFSITSGAVYLDVEGVPDREFYYLIGMRYRSGDEDRSSLVLGGRSIRRAGNVGILRTCSCADL